jgi:hypothetical protein
MKITDPEVVNLQQVHRVLKRCQEDDGPENYTANSEAMILQVINDANLQNPGDPPSPRDRLTLPEARVYVGKLTPDHVRRIIEGWREFFSGLVDEKLIAWEVGGKGRVVFYLGALTRSSRFHQSIVAYSDPVSQAMIALQQHFVRSGLVMERIMRCAECKTIFIRDRKPQVGREQFCSPPCARKAASRAYFERQGASDARAVVPTKDKLTKQQAAKGAPAAALPASVKRRRHK